MRIAVQFGLSFALLLTLCASAFAGTVADGVKIAFVGDTSTSAKFKEVLNLIKREKADLMIVPGDTDYGSGEAKWDGLIKSVLGDEAALIARIEDGLLAGAALDVFGGSAGGVNPRLLALARANKVLLTAHMASATLEARVEMGETVIVNIRAFVDGHQPPHRVLPDLTARAARG